MRTQTISEETMGQVVRKISQMLLQAALSKQELLDQVQKSFFIGKESFESIFETMVEAELIGEIENSGQYQNLAKP